MKTKPQQAIDPDWLAPLPPRDVPTPVMRPSVSYWRQVWRRLLRNPLAMAGLVVLCLLLLFAIAVPWLSSHPVHQQSLPLQNLPPSATHWFGTDDLGRDVFVRTGYGARISLFVGLCAALIDLVIGVLYGSYSALKGGRTDTVMMRIVEVLYGIPYLLIVILLMVLMGPGLLTIIVALSCTGWIGMARLVRGQLLSLKHSDFVQASRSFGASSLWLIRHHLLPNIVGVVLVQLTLSIPAAIFAEAFLSFLGLGVQAPYASWGVMSSDALGAILSGEWWQLLFPALGISLTMFAFNVLGDGLQDAIDPKS